MFMFYYDIRQLFVENREYHWRDRTVIRRYQRQTVTRLLPPQVAARLADAYATAAFQRPLRRR